MMLLKIPVALSFNFFGYFINKFPRSLSEGRAEHFYAQGISSPRHCDQFV